MLSNDTIATVKSTVPLLADKGLEITQTFYSKLFTRHPELQNIFNMANQKDTTQATALADAVFAYASHIDQLDVLLPAVKRIASKHASLAVLPEQYPVVGQNLLESIQEVLDLPNGHPALGAWEEAYGALAQIFIDAEEAIYAHNEAQPGGWRGFRTFYIADIIEETPEVTSFLLCPKDNQPVCDYHAGQYVGVKVSPAGSDYDQIRQYSLSNWGDRDGGQYRITVKAEQDGAVSQYLHASSPGDEVQLSAPAGEFTLAPDTKKHVFISGGVGITPLFSLLQAALAQPHQPQDILFIECCRSPAHQIFREELAALQAQQGFNLKRAFEQGDGGDVTGYLNAAVLDQWIDDKQAQVYFCGPKPFMGALSELLEQIGVPESHCHYEVFGPTVSVRKVN